MSELLELPDFDDEVSVGVFFGVLSTPKYAGKHGVKTLMKHSTDVLKYSIARKRSLREAERVLATVNGKRTELQLQKDHERAWRNTAQKFYETFTDSQIVQHVENMFGLTVDVSYTRETLINMLVDDYVLGKTDANG